MTGRPLGAGSSLLLPASWGASGGCGRQAEKPLGVGKESVNTWTIHVLHRGSGGGGGSRCWMQLAPWWFLLHL